MYQQTTVQSKIGNMFHLARILQKRINEYEMIFNSITLPSKGVTIVNVNIPTSVILTFAFSICTIVCLLIIHKKKTLPFLPFSVPQGPIDSSAASS